MSTHQVDYAVEAAILSNACYRRFRELPVCEKLKEDELIHLFSAMRSESITAGTTIYEAGSESNQTINLIIKGTVSVSAAGSNLYAKLGADRKSTRLNSSHITSSYAVFCLKKKKNKS